MPVLVVLGVFLTTLLKASSIWLPREAAEWAIKDFEEHEKNRSTIEFKGHDRRVSWPFITGDGFKEVCQHVCEDFNRCRMYPDKVKDGDLVFVKSDFYEFFANDVTKRIHAKYVIVSHNGDLSAPDGQSDAPGIRMSKYIGSESLLDEHKANKLIDHHGQNLWWRNSTLNSPRPDYLHCLPIGFENRMYPVGRQVHVYASALQRFIVDRPSMTAAEKNNRPLLLVAFYPKSRVPDRAKVLHILRAYDKDRPPNPFYNHTDLSHIQWLQGITEHKFVLAPFGHGLDTHRVSEILLMGGIPVMRRSTISSCFDDSDNDYRGTSRGSLPVVIVDKWEDVTKERLDFEWERISTTPSDKWDWKRLFIYHWIDRLKAAAKAGTMPS